jgi:GntR family transcriptional regulator, transcriptional repressor for pyruvate dehydrogenase complex
MDGTHSEQQRLRAYIDRALRERRERLLPEPQLSELLDIPRGRLRTHLKRLEKDGLIWRHVGKGTFIGPRTTPLLDSVSVGSVSPSDVIDARLMIEPLLAGKAAVHARRSDIEAMERCLEDNRAATSFVAWKHGDDRLHRLIAEAAQNPLLLMLYDVVHGYARKLVAERMEQALGHNPAPTENSNEQHAAIVAAIKRQDPEAAETGMRRHLTSIRSLLFGNR